MIGANSSPLSMFTGGSSNGPSMYQIGYAGGPGGGINAALNSTIDRYHANIDAQNQQANKLAQIQAEGTAGLGKEQAIIDYKNAAETKKAADINAMNSSRPDNGIRMVNVNGRNIFLQDRTNDTGVTNSSVVQPSPYPTMDQIIGQKMQSQMDNTAPNLIQQGANGAVADTTGQQGAKPLDTQTASMLLKQAGGDKNKARLLAQQAGFTF